MIYYAHLNTFRVETIIVKLRKVIWNKPNDEFISEGFKEFDDDEKDDFLQLRMDEKHM